jgi:PAS domain S-box-containing protein
MDETSLSKSGLYDARLAVHATGATGVWLWSPDGTRVWWANAAGCATFGAGSPAALAAQTFDPGDPARIQVVRLAATLSQNGAARLERLRGFAGHGQHPLWRPLVCSCSLLRIDHACGVLVMATEAAGPALSLAEQVDRLGLDADAAIAAVTPDGAILFATAEATRRLAGATNVDVIRAHALCATATAAGAAAGDTRIGPATVRRIGSGANTVLLVRFEPNATADESSDNDQNGRQTNEQQIALGNVQETADSNDAGSQVAALAVPTLAAEAPAHEPGAIAAAADADADYSDPDADAEPAEPSIADMAPTEEIAPRPRYPLRFVWQMAPDGRFTLGSDEFTEIIGTSSAIALGRPWQEINADLGLDPAGRVAQAVATRETWSNITISWPVDGSAQRLDIELAGLPAFDRNRAFLGYRGFGVCRDIERIESLRAMRRLAMFAPMGASADVANPEAVTNTAKAATPAPVAKNILLFRGPAALVDAKPGAEPRSPALSPGEHNAFRELARQLTARLQDSEALRDRDDISRRAQESSIEAASIQEPAAQEAAVQEPAPQATAASEHAFMFDEPKPADAFTDHALLNRLPVGILVYRLDELLFANRAFLAMTGYADLNALTAAGGLDALFVESGIGALADTGEGGRRFAIATRSGNQVPVEGRLFAVSWNGEPAFAVLLAKTETNERITAAEAALRHAEGEARELRTILEGVTDAVAVVDGDGCILSIDRGGETLFGRSRRELEGTRFANLIAPASRSSLADALKQAQRDAATVTFTVQARDGVELPVSATIRRIGEGGVRFGIAIRDLARPGGSVAVPTGATAGADKSAALTKLCHDARTPLNSILGFCDMMLEQRFGPIGNDRYRDYVDNMRKAGTHLMTLLADAADLAGIEAGTFRLSPTAVVLADVVSECVLQMQPQANEARVIVRTSFAPAAHRVIADIGAVRQIVGNLLGQAIASSRPGGQVIVSTGMTPAGDVVLRLRDNGNGLSEKEIAAALQPAGPQETTPPWSSTGQTLPLTKALAEANHARLKITSKPNDGSLFEVSFTAKAEIADRAFGAI